jgi:hypothetical protein
MKQSNGATSTPCNRRGVPSRPDEHACQHALTTAALWEYDSCSMGCQRLSGAASKLRAQPAARRKPRTNSRAARSAPRSKAHTHTHTHTHTRGNTHRGGAASKHMPCSRAMPWPQAVRAQAGGARQVGKALKGHLALQGTTACCCRGHSDSQTKAAPLATDRSNQAVAGGRAHTHTRARAHTYTHTHLRACGQPSAGTAQQPHAKWWCRAQTCIRGA